MTHKVQSQLSSSVTVHVAVTRSSMCVTLRCRRPSLRAPSVWCLVFTNHNYQTDVSAAGMNTPDQESSTAYACRPLCVCVSPWVSLSVYVRCGCGNVSQGLIWTEQRTRLFFRWTTPSYYGLRRCHIYVFGKLGSIYCDSPISPMQRWQRLQRSSSH